jgi:hypothetical protein
MDQIGIKMLFEFSIFSRFTQVPSFFSEQRNPQDQTNLTIVLLLTQN